MKKSFVYCLPLLLCSGIMLPGCAQSDRQQVANPPASNTNLQLPANMHLVQPITTAKNNNMHTTNASQPQPRAVEELKIGQGNFFSYALPPGWRVGEDGQFALTLVSPDNKAITVMVGNAGLMPGYPAGRFIYEKLMALQPQGLSLSEATSTTPVKGFQEAYRFQLSYQLASGSYVGEAVCHITNYYGGCVMAMTAAIAERSQWQSYASWLPQVSRQLSATNGAAFGMQGVMQQNLQESKAFGEAMRSYREWSQAKWQEVTDQRNQSVDRQHEQFRENLGAVNTYGNPYNNKTPLQLSTQYKYYWIDQQGTVVGTDDPSVNPNHGSTKEWKQLQQKKEQ